MRLQPTFQPVLNRGSTRRAPEQRFGQHPVVPYEREARGDCGRHGRDYSVQACLDIKAEADSRLEGLCAVIDTTKNVQCKNSISKQSDRSLGSLEQ